MAKVVRFLQALAPYNPGETAAFSDNEADSMVMRGICAHTDIKPTFAERSPDLDPPKITARELQAAVHEAETRSTAAARAVPKGG